VHVLDHGRALGVHRGAVLRMIEIETGSFVYREIAEAGDVPGSRSTI
jgi:hypothetical protein